MEFSLVEMLLVVLVAIVVVPPSELPNLLLRIGRFAGKMRRLYTVIIDEIELTTNQPPASKTAAKSPTTNTDEANQHQNQA